MYHYYVLLTNSTIELDPTIADSDDRLAMGKITVLPQEPESVKDGTLLRDAIYEAIDEVVESERNIIYAELNREYEEQGVAACLEDPQDWIVAIAIWLFGVISTGATWDAIKLSVKAMAASFIQKEKAALPERHLGLSEIEIERLVKVYMRKDFSKEEVLHKLYQSIQQLHKRRGSEFDPKEIETAILKRLIDSRRASIKERREREASVKREKAQNRKDLIQELIKNDSDGTSDEEEVLALCEKIDLYLLNGIETQFLLSQVSPRVSQSILTIVSKVPIPKDVLRDFRRFNILGENLELTAFGKLTFQRLAKLRSDERIPKSVFQQNWNP